MEERGRLIEQILGMQACFYRRVHGGARSEWLTVDLTMPQLKTMFVLRAVGPATMGNLAHALNVKLPTVTGIVDRLVDGGLVERVEDPEDRRRVVCRLTEPGTTTVDRLHRAGAEQMRSILECLDTDDLRSVEQALRALDLGAVTLEQRSLAASLAS
ncbi:MAG: MarR family transcriptional regulator [Chloroflexi bacterium]|nr:MarR family transcriptional regulator [Chloroflexota bacterium]